LIAFVLKQEKENRRTHNSYVSDSGDVSLSRKRKKIKECGNRLYEKIFIFQAWTKAAATMFPGLC